MLICTHVYLNASEYTTELYHRALPRESLTCTALESLGNPNSSSSIMFVMSWDWGQSRGVGGGGASISCMAAVLMTVDLTKLGQAGKEEGNGCPISTPAAVLHTSPRKKQEPGSSR